MHQVYFMNIQHSKLPIPNVTIQKFPPIHIEMYEILTIINK